MSLTLLVGNDNAIRLPNVREGQTGSALNNQSISGQVLDAQGAALGSPVTFTLSYEAGSAGNYVGCVPYNAGLVDGTSYILSLDLNAGTGLRAHWEFPFVAAVRREKP